MPAGLTLLVSRGPQDVYLTGEPQVSLFHGGYRRHTNFATSIVPKAMSGSGWKGLNAVTLDHLGDLAHRAHLRFRLPDVTLSPPSATAGKETYFQWTKGVGHALLRWVEVRLGSVQADRHTGEWLHLWNELTDDSVVRSHYRRMTNACSHKENTVKPGGQPLVIPGCEILIPLKFWWNRDPRWALPLVALQYTDVTIRAQMGDPSGLFYAGVRDTKTGDRTPDVSVASLDMRSEHLLDVVVEYIFLEPAERRSITMSSHEALIEQVREMPAVVVPAGGDNRAEVSLPLEQPVKELVWVCQRQDAESGAATPAQPYLPQPSVYMMRLDDCPVCGETPIDYAKLLLAGNSVIEAPGSYFWLIQPYQAHSGSPAPGIHAMSFAMRPEQRQPSGSVNLSRFDQKVLQLRLKDLNPEPIERRVRAYAVAYNVLRVTGGMAGLGW